MADSSAVLQQIEEIGALEMTGKPLGDRVEQLLKRHDSPADVQAILNALPPSVARSHFLTILENKDTKNRAEIAKAYTSVINEVQFQDPRKAYDVMYEALSSNDTYKSEAHTFLVKYLQTFSSVQDLGGSQNVEQRACRAIVNCLSLPVWKFDEVHDLVPVRALAASRSADNVVCHQLLQAFAFANYQAYQKISQQHSELIQKWGLDQAALTDKIRLLALCKLAHDNADTPVSYKDIASTLGVPEEEVEDFVVKAISKKLLAAKIDQVAKNISVSYAHHAMFGVEQWRQLSDTLQHWQAQLKRLSP
jgi:translation initiation factor 3 subunit M